MIRQENDNKFQKILRSLRYGVCSDKTLNILKDSRFVITDSGGIQEEASFLNKKVIVCRKTTERPEGINSGHITLCREPNKFFNIANDIKNVALEPVILQLSVLAKLRKCISFNTHLPTYLCGTN